VHKDPEEPSEVDHTFYDIKVSNLCLEKVTRTEAFTTFDIVCPQKHGQHPLELKIDTGAGGNTIPLRTLKQMYPDGEWKKVLCPIQAKLTAYNGTNTECLGYIELVCRYNQSPWSTHMFYVVRVPEPAVAGLPTCEQLNLVTIHAATKSPAHAGEVTTSCAITVSSVYDLTQIYPEQFETIGKFKYKAKLHLKENATPTIDPPRKCSVHLKEKLKAELQRMEQIGIIRKIDHHTDWCSSNHKEGRISPCMLRPKASELKS
jgi:hypothetical protein